MSNEYTPLQRAALEWWESKKPEDYTLEQHLENPEINCSDEAEEMLALEVSIMVTARAV